MALDLKTEEIFTAFLNKSITELEKNQTKFSDYCSYVQKEKLENPNVTILLYSSGGFYFELIADHDNDNRVMTQRTYTAEAGSYFDEIALVSKSRGKSSFYAQKYMEDLNRCVDFRLGQNNHGDFVQADYL